jgi:Family of unknown function (DUF5947)
MSGRPLAPPQRLPASRPMLQPGGGCDLCRQEIAGAHLHVVNLETRGLLCACRACYLLFAQEGAEQRRYRPVPERYEAVPDFVLSDEQWDALQVPLAMVFFFFNSALNRMVAFYPSPAGASESLLPLGIWAKLTRANPLLETVRPDVEALLVYKCSDDFECHIVPIDACYELVGRVRRHWKCLAGGQIEAFFATVRSHGAGSAVEVTP